MSVRDVAHERRRDRPAHDGHDDERRAELGVVAETTDAQRKNRREHHGHEEERAEHRIHAKHPATHTNRRQRHVDGRVGRQHAVRFELADYGTTG
jgi:hypothetical protein